MVNFCPKCGREVNSTWNACPDCGSNLILNQETPPPQRKIGAHQDFESKSIPQTTLPQSMPKVAPKNLFGTIAIITGIIGFFFLQIICGAVAIYYGAKGLREDSNTSISYAGLILGVVDITYFFILLFIFPYAALWWLLY